MLYTTPYKYSMLPLVYPTKDVCREKPTAILLLYCCTVGASCLEFLDLFVLYLGVEGGHLFPQHGLLFLDLLQTLRDVRFIVLRLVVTRRRDAPHHTTPQRTMKKKKKRGKKFKNQWRRQKTKQNKKTRRERKLNSRDNVRANRPHFDNQTQVV